MEKKCPNCGHVFNKNDDFCPNCDLFIPESENQLNKGNVSDESQNNQSTDNKQIIQPDTDEPILFKHRIRDESPNDSQPVNNLPEDSLKNDNQDANTAKEQKEMDVVQETTSTISNVPNGDIIKTEETTSTQLSDKTDTIFEQSTTITTEKSDKQTTHSTDSGLITPGATTGDGNNNDTPPKNSNSSRRNQLPPSKKSKKGLLTIAVLLVLIASGGVMYNNHQKNIEQEQATQLIATAETAVKSLFLNSEHVFLKENMTKNDLTKAQTDLNKIKNQSNYNDLNRLFETAEATFNRQTELNDLFKEPVLNGQTLSLDDAYVKNADNTALKQIDGSKVTAFDQLFNEGLSEAIAQKETLNTAQTAIEKVYKNNKVTDTATTELYEAAVNAIKPIKDPDIKKEYTTQLDAVKKALDEKAETAKKQEQEREKDLASNQQTDSNQGTTANSQTPKQNGVPSTYGGRWGERQDGQIDLSNSAWAWNPGVQEKFISTVISRGYVANGGYSLVPKFIENGDGYYDLYATTTSRLFPNSKPEEFPIYVVTVNAKTGWFRGNGPN
ncbi:cell division site-positioning protein MapZ family protein [Vagococcus penaei]|nr:cell division site-positioning protein MapZ family protein [Vagococcus penaei]